MSDKQKTAFLVAAAMAILHNGKRYEQNDVIELTEEEEIGRASCRERVCLYV